MPRPSSAPNTTGGPVPSFDTIIAFFTSLDPVWFVGLMFGSAFFADFVRMVRYSKADELERRARAEDSTLSQVTSEGRAEPVVHPGGRFTGLDIG